MATLKLGLEDIKSTDLLNKARLIHSKMKGNPNFPAPIIAMAAFEAEINSYADAIDKADSRDREAIVARNDQRLIIISMIRQLGHYVNMVANGDLGIILSSGFDVRNKSHKLSKLQRPINCVVKRDETPGTVSMTWKSMRKRVRYFIEITTDDPAETNPEWKLAGTTTKSKFKIEGLELGRYYYFRVKAESANAGSAYSGLSAIMAA